MVRRWSSLLTLFTDFDYKKRSKFENVEHFLILEQCVLRWGSVQGHDGLTQHFWLSGTLALSPSTQMSKNYYDRLHQYGPERFGRLILQQAEINVGMKGLKLISSVSTYSNGILFFLSWSISSESQRTGGKAV